MNWFNLVLWGCVVLAFAIIRGEGSVIRRQRGFG